MDFLHLSKIPRHTFANSVNQHLNLFPSDAVSQKIVPIYFDYANLKLQPPARDQVRAVLQRILPFKTVVDADEAYFERYSHSSPLGTFLPGAPFLPFKKKKKQKNKIRLTA